MHALIAAEFHLIPPDSMSIFQIMHLAQTAEKRRADRHKALSEGKTYIG
jgi:hypothetical protein